MSTYVLSSKFLTSRPAVSASPSTKTVEKTASRQAAQIEVIDKAERRRVPLKVIDGITLLTADALVDLMTNSPHDESIFARDTPTKGNDQSRIRQVTVPPVMEDSQTERLLERDYLMLDLRDDHVYRAYHIHDCRVVANPAIQCPQMLINQDKYPPALFALKFQKNSQTKLILVHDSEAVSMHHARMMFRRGFDNVCILRGTVNEFYQHYPEMVQLNEVGFMIKIFNEQRKIQEIIEKRENRIEKRREKLQLRQPLNQASANLKGQMSSPSLIVRPKSLANSLQEQSYHKSKIVTHQPNAGNPPSKQRSPQQSGIQGSEAEEENVSNWKIPQPKQATPVEAAGVRKPPKSALKANPSIAAPPDAQQSALEHMQQLRLAEMLVQRQRKQQVTEKPNKMRYL